MSIIKYYAGGSWYIVFNQCLFHYDSVPHAFNTLRAGNTNKLGRDLKAQIVYVSTGSVITDANSLGYVS